MKALIDANRNFITIVEPPLEMGHNEGKQIGSERFVNDKQGGSIRFMRWGWFEDNIISKYISLVHKSKGNPKVTFRSIEYDRNSAGEIFRDRPKRSIRISSC